MGRNRRPLLTNFFSIWTGDVTKAQAMTAAIEDWRDPDDDVRQNGAEAAYYAPLNYAPRNGSLGVADFSLIRGLSSDNFQLHTVVGAGQAALRDGLDAHITSAGGGALVNPNFASEMVLRSIPGLTKDQIETILARRAERLFDDINDLQSRIGLSASSPALKYLTLSRSPSAISAVARVTDRSVMRSERRVMNTYSGFDFLTGRFELKSALGHVQRGGPLNR
jgi:hypothetical protein